jgi:PAS domain S-box-containing protein
MDHRELLDSHPEVSRQLLDAAPDAMIVVDSDGTIEFANLQTEEVFGHLRDELVGQPLDVLIPDRFRTQHQLHVQRYGRAPAARAMRTGLELLGRRKDGVEIPVEVSLSPVTLPTGPGVCAAIRDVTERRSIEDAARTNAVRLASAVEAIQDAIALFDAEDRLVLCNTAYRQLIGKSAWGSILRRPYEAILDLWLEDLEFTSDEERTRFRAERLEARRNPTPPFDVRTRGGRTLRVSDRPSPDGGLVKTIWDLTDDERLARELREARAAAEAASAAKTEFLSSMSHELRTPLNAILGFAQLIARDKREPPSPRHRERLEQILRGGEHLLRLIDEILDLSRIESRRISISTEPVSVLDVLEEVRATLEALAAQVRVDVCVLPPDPRLPPVYADRTRFVQIVTNFGSNAVKYNRSGGSVKLRALRTDGDRVRVAVDDTGIGIPSDRQGALFQPFQRAGQESGPIEGTGIGLAIAKRLAEIMGGQVGFESEPGVGSSFWVELPAHTMTPVSDGAHKVRKDAVARLAGGRARCVLYVEDNPANVAFMRDVLSDLEGVELVTAPTAEVGVELARERLPDVVVMDINLPGMSGGEALLRLRAHPDTARIPVIALTAAASERDRLRGLQTGFYKYLTKPVKLDELWDALEGLLTAR